MDRLFAAMGETEGIREVWGVGLDWTGCSKFKRPGTSRKTLSVVAARAQRSRRVQDSRHLEVIGEEEVLLPQGCIVHLGSTQGSQLEGWARNDDKAFIASFLGFWGFLDISSGPRNCVLRAVTPHGWVPQACP